jgi:hypothetical protein
VDTIGEEIVIDNVELDEYSFVATNQGKSSPGYPPGKNSPDPHHNCQPESAANRVKQKL